jgi:acetyltransferase-like isoleucine patch superfamily enzyme
VQIVNVRHDAQPDEASYRVGDHVACSIGAFSYAYPKLTWWPETPNRLVVGKFCSIAADVTFMLGGEHDMSAMTTYPFAHMSHFAGAAPPTPAHVVDSASCHVGNDVWIGREALVRSGVTIGDGAVIGARTVVAKDVEPYQVVVGNPARVIRSRFEPEEIAILLKVRWWDWPVEKIRENIGLLMSRDVSALLATA